MDHAARAVTAVSDLRAVRGQQARQRVIAEAHCGDGQHRDKLDQPTLMSAPRGAGTQRQRETAAANDTCQGISLLATMVIPPPQGLGGFS